MVFSLLEWLPNSLLQIALQNTLTTAILVPFVLILCRIFRRRPAVQHLLWLVLLVKFITPPVPGIIWPLPAELFPSAHEQEQAPKSFAVFAQTSEQSALDLATHSTREEQVLPNRSVSSSVETEIPLPSAIAARTTLSLIWILGASRLLVIYQSRYRRLLEILAKATPASESLSETVLNVAKSVGVVSLKTVVSSEVTSPFLSCTPKVQLVWPKHIASATPESYRSLIAHEAAHLRRHDYAIAWLELLATIVWWWNPIFWFVRRQLRCTSEMACDAIALDTFPADRCFYAEKLLELSVGLKTGEPPLVLAVGGGTPSSLERRISMIVSEQACYKLGWLGFFSAIILGIGAAPGWALTKEVDNQQDPPKSVVVSPEKLKHLNEPLNLDSATPILSPRAKHVELNDGTTVPLDGEGILAPNQMRDSYVVSWSGSLTIPEFVEPIRVQLHDKPLVLDLRTGEGNRQALIQIRAVHGPVQVEIQTVRSRGIDPIRLELRSLHNVEPNGEKINSQSVISLATQASDIEAIGLEGSISIRTIVMSEGRAIDKSLTPGKVETKTQP